MEERVRVIGALFNFSRLINKYKSEFKTITLASGYYNDAGDWVKGEESEITLTGAVISFTENKIYRSDGTLTTNDKRLFMLSPIDNALKGSKVIYEGNVYNIQDSRDNARFTGVWAYTLKFVSAFNEGAET